MHVEIRELDVTDPTASRAWFDAMDGAIRPDRPHALLASWEAFELGVTEPTRYYRRTYLQACEGEEILGVAELELPLEDNVTSSALEVNVLPQHRRRGVGRALWDEGVARARAQGRTTAGGEATVDPALSQAGVAFARAVGCEEKHREDHLLVDLPVPVAAIDPAYDVVTWRGRCPDEHRAGYLDMRNRMNTDVPTGEVEADPVVLDDARLRSEEERMSRVYDVRVAAARRREDGAFGGYTLLFIPQGADYGWQDDTLVMPDHRGRRLGAVLKSANYADLPDHVTQVHTWTAPSNLAMHHTNTAMGFRVVEHMYEMQAAI